jgi:hypothetical protein
MVEAVQEDMANSLAKRLAAHLITN